MSEIGASQIGIVRPANRTVTQETMADRVVGKHIAPPPLRYMISGERLRSR